MIFKSHVARTALLSELCFGMYVTFKAMFRRRATLNYPYEKGYLQPQISRGARAETVRQR